jgi:hypothetical protein
MQLKAVQKLPKQMTILDLAIQQHIHAVINTIMVAIGYFFAFAARVWDSIRASEKHVSGLSPLLQRLASAAMLKNSEAVYRCPP